ncbi:hypothetical protein [Pseudomonas sp. SDO55104_S430]
MPEFSSILTDITTSIYLSPAWDYIKNVANSAFTTSLAGAFAGATAAQHIAEKGKFRDEIVKEIHKTNAGTMLTLATANLALAIKKQHLKELFDSHQAVCISYESHIKKISTGQIDKEEPFLLQCNLMTLPEITPPIESLQEIVLSNMAHAGFSISIATSLAEAVKSLNTAIAKRNEIINNYKSNQIPEGATVNQLYLGLEYKPGVRNKEYGDVVRAIYEYNDDVIFFSIKLCKEIQDHGSNLIRRYKRRLRGDPPQVAKADFEKAKNGGLLPDEKDYDGWTSGFATPKAEPHDQYKWRRLSTWFTRKHK